MRQQRREDLLKDKKKFFFTIWANMSEVSLQKVEEYLTVPLWQELELSSQDPVILWNAIKATHTIVKQDNDERYLQQRQLITISIWGRMNYTLVTATVSSNQSIWWRAET
jgi:hypothetical protein